MLSKTAFGLEGYILVDLAVRASSVTEGSNGSAGTGDMTGRTLTESQFPPRSTVIRGSEGLPNYT